MAVPTKLEMLTEQAQCWADKDMAVSYMTGKDLLYWLTRLKLAEAVVAAARRVSEPGSMGTGAYLSLSNALETYDQEVGE